jgi:GTPase
MQELLRLSRRSVRWIPEVERRHGAVGDDVVGDPSFEAGDGHDLVEGQPVDHRLAALVGHDAGEPFDGSVNSVLGEPRPGRVAARAVERHPSGEIPHAAGLDRQVGRFEEDRQIRLAHERRGLEQGGQRVVLRRELLAAEQEQRDVDRTRLALGDLAHELQSDCDAALHVAGAAPVDRAVRDPAREVLLRGDGVVVAREDEQRRVGTALPRPQKNLVSFEDRCEPRGHERPQPLAHGCLVEALRGNVHQLERATGQAVGEGAHDRRAYSHIERGILPLMTAVDSERLAGPEPERGLLLAVLAKGADDEHELAELRELARAAGVNPVGELVQHRAQPDPRSYVGKGKLEELKGAYGDARAEVLLVDDELQPTQQRVLEDALSARVVDRTQLILDIFAQHARSAEGKLQVELAQLEYNLPRMRGMWKHLERLAGGGGTAQVGGGVGTRGPGESQLETDRRLANRRITQLRRRLRDLRAHRATRRKARTRAGTPTVALAGYTNVGKSTLLNALTGADVTVEDRLFETLDPTTRGFEHDGKRYLVTDTVGFIRRLPTQLVEGFASTLEETLVADLVLHVIDASLTEEVQSEQIRSVDAVLAEIGAGDIPVEVVLNKVDRLDAVARRRVGNRFPGAVQVSATRGDGLDELKARIAGRFADRFDEVRLLVPYEDGRVLAELYALGAPIDERTDTEDGVLVRARLPHRDVRRFAQYLVAGEFTTSASSA